MSAEKGINILGYINKQFGLGEGVRSNIRSISSVNIPYVLNDFIGELSNDILDESTLKLSTGNPYKINLIQINVDNFDKILSHDPGYFSNKYNIGFWAWELELFPTKFQKYIDLLDEIWVPSNFCLNAIGQVSNKPVLRFMHSIDIVCSDTTRADFNLPEDKLIYLTMFDYHSSIERKNPYATIKAFEEAFGKNTDKALLVIKTSLGTNFKKIKEELKSYIKDNKSIRVIEDILPRKKLNALINLADVFVSLHRSEGFGLTMAEAMYLGKPVIATAYSANTEFMTSENSFLVSYKLTDTGNDYLYPELNNRWADPDIKEAGQIMKILAEKDELRVNIGLKAEEHIKHILSPQTIGAKIKARLDYLYDIAIHKAKSKERETIQDLQKTNAHLQNQVEALKKIKSVQWKLAFKNLKNKLFNKNRKYVWED